MSAETAYVRPAPRSSAAAWIAARWYLAWKLLLLVICKIAFRVRFEGRDHEPRKGPFIVAANHVSFVDPPIVGMGLRHQPAYMTKEELFSVPILGPWLRSIGCFPVRRGAADRRAIRRSLEILQQGGVLVIFPEGTRSPDGRLKDPEPGAAMIALRTGIRVLPAAVINSHHILPKGARWPRFGRITVRFGPPFDVPKVEGHLDHLVLEEWGRRIMRAIGDLLPDDQKGTSTSRA